MNNRKNNKDFILSETLRLLSEQYPFGLYEYLFKFHFLVYKKMREVEDEITENYDNGSVEDLKNILAVYWKLHIESIKKFKSERQLNFDIGEVKIRINNELRVT